MDAHASEPVVTLRSVEESDVEFVAALYGEDGGPYVEAPGVSVDSFRERWRRDRHRGVNDGKLMVVSDGRTVGLVSWVAQRYFSTARSRCWNVGVIVATDHRGRGIGAAAQRALAAYLFEATDVERVEAGTDVDNMAERHALRAAGFSEEGVLRCAQFRDDRWHDMALYSRTRAEHHAARVL
jgi:RimJ/RimL family protein N-acetyltransferase